MTGGGGDGDGDCNGSRTATSRAPTGGHPREFLVDAGGRAVYPSEMRVSLASLAVTLVIGASGCGEGSAVTTSNTTGTGGDDATTGDPGGGGTGGAGGATGGGGSGGGGGGAAPAACEGKTGETGDSNEYTITMAGPVYGKETRSTDGSPPGSVQCSPKEYDRSMLLAEENLYRKMNCTARDHFRRALGLAFRVGMLNASDKVQIMRDKPMKNMSGVPNVR